MRRNGVPATAERDRVCGVVLRSWADFIEAVSLAQSKSPVDDPWFFRGQPADWPLLPSLARDATDCGLRRRETLAVEAAALKEFKSQAHLYLPAAMIMEVEDNAGWWVLMQHHGVQTRLLDWSASPYVAAYFASAGHPDQQGVIWQIHVPKILDAMKWAYPQIYSFPANGAAADAAFGQINPDPVLYFLEVDLHTERMAAQQTRFSVSYDILADHGRIIQTTRYAGHERSPHRKLVIPPRLKPEFLRQLREMNITARSLFPGVDGFGRSVSELVRLCAHHERRS